MTLRKIVYRVTQNSVLFKTFVRNKLGKKNYDRRKNVVVHQRYEVSQEFVSFIQIFSWPVNIVAFIKKNMQGYQNFLPFCW